MAGLPDGLIQSLEDVATRLRVDSIRATTAAGSGHPSSSASAADLVAALFFDAMRFDVARPRDLASDRFVLSKGHAAPVLYAAWAELGVLERDDLLTLRDLASDLEGHPTPRLPFVDVATGSLGQGLGAGVGLALGARLAGSEARVWVLLGDGETAEGSVWEAAALAAQRRLDNLVAIVDVNALGQSGPTMHGHDLAAYQRRFTAFGWRAVTVDGHDMRAIVAALRRARAGRGAPTAVIARTVKGRGIEGVEGTEGWHGKALARDAADRAVAALEGRLHHLPPPPVRARRSRARVPSPDHAPGEPEPEIRGEIATREAYGRALVRLGAADPRVVVLDGDVKNSTYAERFAAAFPERYVEAFIAEQNMVSVAAGLAAQGWVPFASSFACFLTRAADQVRMAGISRSNLKLCGSHAGVSIGEDGPSQMALEDLALFRAVPEGVVLYPADGLATDACVQLAAAHPGIVYIRTTRMKTPAVYPGDAAFRIGGLAVLQQSTADRLTLVAAGITLHEAIAAHAELAQAGIAVRVIDLYCVKPVDREALLAAARATANTLVTVEDHYEEGGLGSAVLEAVGDRGIRVHRLAVREIPRSGPPRKLLERHGIGRAAIVARVKSILEEGSR
ncbi:MAG: transketolase [Candidatus Rokubacteria bacterium]|nr:transketolase [Candidatus Rokubacteria bacterium]